MSFALLHLAGTVASLLLLYVYLTLRLDKADARLHKLESHPHNNPHVRDELHARMNGLAADVTTLKFNLKEKRGQ